MSAKKIIKSCPRRSSSPSPEGPRSAWSFAEERQLLQFVVEYNKGKKEWDLGKTMLDKYVRRPQKSGHPTERTERGLLYRLQILRRSIRNNIGSDEYGLDLESRKKLAARSRKKAKRNSSLERHERRRHVTPRSRGRSAVNQWDDDNDTDRSTSREVTPHPIKTGNRTTTRHSKAVSSFPHPNIAVKFDVIPEAQSLNAAALPGPMELNHGEPAGPSRKAGEEDQMDFDTGHGLIMVPVEKSAADRGLSQLATTAAPATFVPRLHAAPAGRMPETGIKAMVGAPTNPVSGNSRLENGVMPINPAQAGTKSSGSNTTVITLDDTPAFKKEVATAVAGDRSRVAALDDFAIVKQLAATPSVTLNEAFTMYFKNKDLYKRLYLELAEK